MISRFTPDTPSVLHESRGYHSAFPSWVPEPSGYPQARLKREVHENGNLGRRD